MRETAFNDRDFEVRIAALRSETFELLDQLGPSLHGRRANLEVTLAAVKLQNVANELGAIEDLARRGDHRESAA